MTIRTAGLFDPGEIRINRGLAKYNPHRFDEYLNRHLMGDWGDLDQEDQTFNDLAVKTGDLRIWSAYKADNIPGVDEILIITEADRLVTTVLRPEDY